MMLENYVLIFIVLIFLFFGVLAVAFLDELCLHIFDWSPLGWVHRKLTERDMT
jgi:hypothetical protein